MISGSNNRDHKSIIRFIATLDCLKRRVNDPFSIIPSSIVRYIIAILYPVSNVYWTMFNLNAFVESERSALTTKERKVPSLLSYHNSKEQLSAKLINPPNGILRFFDALKMINF